MGGNRLIYQNWIVELGVDPGNKDVLTNGTCQGREIVSLETLKERLSSDGSVSSSDEKELLRQAQRRAYISKQVARALMKLTDDEKEFVERFYYSGQGYREISEKSGRAVYKLEALHKRAIKKLKRELAPLVMELYGLATAPNGISSSKKCLICESPFRKEIDRLIAARDKKDTWRPVIKILKEKYGLKIKTPQILIGHEKYH